MPPNALAPRCAKRYTETRIKQLTLKGGEHMIHSSLSHTSTEPVYLALTADLDEQDPVAEQTYIALGNEQVCLQVVRSENSIV